MATKNFLVDINLSTNEIQNAVVHGVTAFPTSPSPRAGQICYRTDLSMMYQYNGSSWVAVGINLSAGTNIGISNNTINNTAAHSAEKVGGINGSTGNIELYNIKQTNGEVDVDPSNPAIIYVDPNGDQMSSSNPLTTMSSLADVRTDMTVTVDSNTTDTTVAKTYVIKQGGSSVGEIKIPKDLVVESGSVVTGTWSGNTFTPSASGTDKALALVLANNAGTIYINVADLCDVYTAGQGLFISQNNEISLDEASTQVLGGVQIGNNISVSNGVISINSSNVISALGNQSPNRVFAGPASGNSSSTPTFRALVLADLPDLTSSFVKAYNISNPALTQSGGVVTWAIENTSFGNCDGRLSTVTVYRESDGAEVGVEILHTQTKITIKFNSSSNVAAATYHAIIHAQKEN